MVSIHHNGSDKAFRFVHLYEDMAAILTIDNVPLSMMIDTGP